ncbi:MAG: DEAD/DEAH box helicase family protein [Deltaproteobacteria bacterium]|nr:DEAD/DEAH box helicase family protein [Deltaproteobacteria bacterium]
MPSIVPEQGQMVRVRGRHFIVQDVWPGAVDPRRQTQHRVRLEALDDDQLGETLDVIWEHEVGPTVHDDLGLPAPEDWDPAGRFDAFLLASRWSLSTVLDALPLQAPFRGAIQVEDYQLEPVVRALRMPRVNLLIADDVGLGKTIEAGMVMQELLARQRIRRVLVICPASLQKQWAEEMDQKFALRFEVVDRDYMQRLRREYGAHVNPWASYPRLITSMDFLKREEPQRTFRAALRPARFGGLRDWDLLIVDEAHNMAPSGRTNYVRDSDRTEMLRQVIPHFEHRLFLTATPHNGYTPSFTALLELLDPLRFARGPTFNRQQLKTVMVRRLKDDMVDALGRRRFPVRHVDALAVELAGAEREMFDTLGRYTRMRLDRARHGDKLPVQFALTLLKKRLLSSPAAFDESIRVHQSHLRPEEAPTEENAKVVAALRERLAEDIADDEEKDRMEETAQAESAAFFDATPEEAQLVERLVELARAARHQPDAKVHVLLDWIGKHLRPGGKWNDDRLLVFSEYRDTMQYLFDALVAQGWGDQVLSFHGGPGQDREAIKKAFRAKPSEDPVRILVATDAASEGLNLQDHCRYLIHWEIPWNPNKMEQRNGRIDRHGQKAEEVFCWHFAYAGWEDQQFLDVVVDKVRTQRADLGSVGDVIAAQVEEALRGERREIRTPEDRRKILRDELEAEVVTRERIRELQAALTEARKKWDIYPDTLRLVLEEALRLADHKGLDPVETGELAGKAWLLRNLPAAWSECRPYIHDAKGRLLHLVFDEEHARDRKDVCLLHLDHPLLKRALGVFRKNLWSVGIHESHRMSRVSYRVVRRRDLPEPAVLLVSRLIAVGQQGNKLHEELLLTGGTFREDAVRTEKPDRLAALLELAGEHVPLPGAVAQLLRKFFPAHERRLREALDERVKAVAGDLEKRLGKRAADEGKELVQLIEERRKEVDKRISTMQKDLDDPQLAFKGWDLPEREQYNRDVTWLKSRKEQLEQERETEPDAAKARYAMRGAPRAFPLAVLYLLPDDLVSGGPSASSGRGPSTGSGQGPSARSGRGMR